MNFFKFKFLLITILSASSCIKSTNSNKVLTSEILKIDNSLFKTKKTLPITLSLPIPICSDESSVILYDFADTNIKKLNMDNSVSQFYPLGGGDNTLGGSYFKDIGYSKENSNELLVSSETIMKQYNTETKLFNEIIDSFEFCSSFNQLYSEIINIKTLNDNIIISQNGIPCINIPRDGASFSTEEFESLRLLKIFSTEKNNITYTFPIPQDNDIFLKNELYVKTAPFVSYNRENRKFYAIINPTKQLYEFELNSSTYQSKILKKWDLNIPNINLPVEYTLNNGIDRNLSDKALEYNFEYNLIKSYKDYVVIMYKPSIPLDVKQANDYVYGHHYFLSIFNINDQEIKTYSLDYNEIVFLNYLDNGDLWFYNVTDSETSNDRVTVINVASIDEIFNNN